MAAKKLEKLTPEQHRDVVQTYRDVLGALTSVVGENPADGMVALALFGPEAEHARAQYGEALTEDMTLFGKTEARLTESYTIRFGELVLEDTDGETAEEPESTEGDADTPTEDTEPEGAESEVEVTA